MSIEKVRAYFSKLGVAEKIREFEASSATVELAAAALGCEGARIAKSLSFMLFDSPILVIAAGDAKIDNSKYKHTFGQKAKMLSFDEVEPLIGHAVGGVCPFALPEGVPVYLDVSLRRFDTVYPAAGSSNSTVALSCDELERASGALSWEDVCKPKEVQ